MIPINRTLTPILVPDRYRISIKKVAPIRDLTEEQLKKYKPVFHAHISEDEVVELLDEPFANLVGNLIDIRI